MSMPGSEGLQIFHGTQHEANVEPFMHGEGGDEGSAVNALNRGKAQSWRNGTPSHGQRGKI
jgi:hypothetical protein